MAIGEEVDPWEEEAAVQKTDQEIAAMWTFGDGSCAGLDGRTVQDLAHACDHEVPE